MSDRSARPRRPGPLLVGCGALLLALAGGFAWVGLVVLSAAGHLEAARDAGARLVAAAGDHDRGGIADAAHALAGELAAARAATSSPVWGVASTAPLIGDDLRAVQTLTAALDDAARISEPAVRAVRSGVIDSAAAGALSSLTDRAARAHAELAALDSTALLPPVADALGQARTRLAEGLPVLRAAAAIAPLVAVADGPEPTRILVMLQNNAELRTGGGITGSYLLIRARGGALTLEDQTSSGDFPARTTPILDVPTALNAMYGDVVARFPQNASMPADFDQAARLATAWWVQRGGDRPDLVVSVDPLVLVAALRVVGPVTLGDGSALSADDALTRLLVDSYRTLDSDGQTALMQDAASRVFAQATAVPPDPMAWAGALAGPIAQGRISVWAAEPRLQRALADGPLGGPQARLEAAGADGYGVWFNDGTGGKMDGFLDVGIAVETARCRADGRSDVLVRLTMTSTAPADAAVSLPGDVTGRGMFGTGVGDIGTSVTVAAPPGTFLVSATKSAVAARVAQADEGGRPTSVMRVNLSPGERNIVEFRFVSAAVGPVAPAIVHTPMLTDPRIADTVQTGCD